MTESELHELELLIARLGKDLEKLGAPRSIQTSATTDPMRAIAWLKKAKAK